MQIGHTKLKSLIRIRLSLINSWWVGASVRLEAAGRFTIPRSRGNGLTSVLFLLKAVNPGILALTRCRIGPGVRVRFSQWPFGKWRSVLRCERI